MRWLWLFGWMAGCTGSVDTTDTGDTGDTEEDLGPAGQLHGTVRDAEGDPVEGAQVNLCLAICSTAQTDAQGAYAFDPLVVGAYSFHVVPPQGSGLAEPLIPWPIEEDTNPTLDVVLPPLEAEVALPTGARAEIEAAPGLFLTLQQGDLKVVFADPPTAVAGARVAEADRLPMDVGGEVLAVWYLSPYEASAEEVGGMPFRIANDLGLSEGQTAQLWRASYWDFAFVSVGLLEAQGDFLVNDALRLPELTTLVLVEPTTTH